MLVALVGQPNSGKSALLSRLTGARVMTSNYPGTTVELIRGRVPGTDVEVLDTPGIYSLHAFTREQQVTRGVLEGRSPDLVVNVLDGTNLARHLSLTLSLLGYRIPMVVAVNCADRLREDGMSVDLGRLSSATGSPAVLTSAITGQGVEELLAEIRKALRRERPAADPSAETSLLGRGQLPGAPPNLDLPALQREAARLAAEVLVTEVQVGRRGRRAPRVSEQAEGWLDRPAAALLGLGVSLLMAWRFISWALPFSEGAVRFLLDPVGAYLGSLLLGVLPESPVSATLAEAIPEGLVLPLATVLPAMILAYALIAFLEDTGFLGRYAALGDLFTGALGLPGQALIPFMLGFGCRVPAILSARILPSEESRRRASVIIAALVPCTATVSLSWTTLARFRGNPLVPIVVLAVSALLLAKILKSASGGEKDPLVLELPPLRMPALRNVAMKTQMRLSGFFTHVLPLVVGMNIGIRLFMAEGAALGPGRLSAFAVRTLGIPPQALAGVLFTMLQRYLAPLFLMQLDLTPREATIAVTMVALGFPCLPSAVTLWREQGPAVVISTFLASTALFLGWGTVLNLVL